VKLHTPLPNLTRFATGVTQLSITASLHYKQCVTISLNSLQQWLTSKTIKWSHYRPGVAQRVGTGIALLFHDCGTRRGWVVSSTPRPHFTPGKDPVPIAHEAGWTQGPVWTGGKSRPHRDSIPNHPALSSVAIPTELTGPPNKTSKQQIAQSPLCVAAKNIYEHQNQLIISMNTTVSWYYPNHHRQLIISANKNSWQYPWKAQSPYNIHEHQSQLILSKNTTVNWYYPQTPQKADTIHKHYSQLIISINTTVSC